MPPGPAYNWFCVLSSTVDVIGHAARLQVAKLPRTVPPGHLPSQPHDASQEPSIVPQIHTIREKLSKQPGNGPKIDVPTQLREEVTIKLIHKEAVFQAVQPATADAKATFALPLDAKPVSEEVSPLQRPTLTASSIPTSRIGRLFHYGGLAASLSFGAASEFARRTATGGGSGQGGVMLTEANVKRLVTKLSQMRGAALKVGQFLSIQDNHVLPPELERVFRMVQDSAHYMPDWQLEKVLSDAFTTPGPFVSLPRTPLYAASIGQVHRAILKAEESPTGNDLDVGVKIRFPGVSDSIDSDLKYIKWLFTAAMGVLPKGLFLDRTVETLSRELRAETSYLAEASHLNAFRTSIESPALQSHPSMTSRTGQFKVPWVWPSSTDSILVMEWMDGTGISKADEMRWSPEDRNEIASLLVTLCLHELFTFRMMQTDPNPSNFLWNSQRKELQLVDFGGTQVYSKEFIDDWLRLLTAAAEDDVDTMLEVSYKVKYLIGGESQTMLDAHTRSLSLLATPFKASTTQPYQFGPGSDWEGITRDIRDNLIPVMLRERKCGPPKETYSLNRKLSGVFLLASKLGASVNTKEIWDSVVSGYRYN